MDLKELIIVIIVYSMLQKNLQRNSKVFIKLLNELNKNDRYVLIERFINNRTLKDVAKDLKVTSSAIKLKEDILLNKIEKNFDVWI